MTRDVLREMLRAEFREIVRQMHAIQAEVRAKYRQARRVAHAPEVV